MRQWLAFVCILLSAGMALQAQPPICEDPPLMTPTCLEACVICDIDGFTGRHESSIPGEAPNDFCTFIVHNAQWIGFIAGSEDLVVDLAVSSCQMGIGLEIALYEAIDCQNFRQISNCFGGMTGVIGPGQSGQVVNNEPLIIGQYYYLVMDGAAGDNCDWTFTVLEGTTEVLPLESSGEIEGPATTCPEVVDTYTALGVVGGTEYEWRLNGTLVGEEPSLEIDWTSAGVYELCLTLANACDEAPPSCRTINVNPFPPVIMDEIICEGDCFALNDSISLCEEGFFEFNFVTEQGCDSLIYVNLTVFAAPTINLAANICEGDSLYIGNTPYFSTDQHTTILQNALGCDSTVVLDLTVVVCEIEGEAEEIPVICHGESSGEIHFRVENGTPPFSYSWEQLGGLLQGAGDVAGINEWTTIEDLPIGTYLITLNDDFGNDLILIQTVTQPEPLNGELLALDYNGFEVSCANAADGGLSVSLLGGVSPYQYVWSTGAQTASVNTLAAGDYAVQVTDAGGCRISLETNLNAPLPLTTAVAFIDPDCDGFASGQIVVQGITGGVAPYLFAFNGKGFGEETTFMGLTAGSYTITTEDANGCQYDTAASLEARIIPIINPGIDRQIELGEVTILNPSANVPLDSIAWSPIDGLSCVDCPNPQAAPFRSTVYTLSVTSVDGCTTLDSVRVGVVLDRDVFVPNVFSPNGDGLNDRLVVFGGPEVLLIRQFEVFNRWGTQVYIATDFPANDPAIGWEGRFLGEILNNDTYIWQAEIEFIDGVTQTYSGSVLLLR